MSGSPKHKLELATAEETEEVRDEAGEARELYLRDGRKLVVAEHGPDQLVEIRSESGMVEVRIRLTEDGPVLQMESARLQLKATESVEIEGRRVEIKADEEVEIDAGGDVRVAGKMIYLN